MTVDVVSKVCTVIADLNVWDKEAGWYKICGKPMFGYRGDFPMCEEHYEFFKPEGPYDQDQD